MKSNIGFLQILTFILVILHGLRFIEIHDFFWLFIVFIAWGDSYARVGDDN